MPTSNASARPVRRRVKTAHYHAALATVAFALFWIPVIIFAKLAGEVVEREPIRADVTIINAIHAGHTAALDNIYLFFTAIGEPVVVAAAGLVLIGYFLYRRRFRAAALIAGGAGGATLANLILKAIFMRSRPSIFTPLVHETSYSFPSGHAMVSSAFVVVCIVLAWKTRFRWFVVVIGGLLTLAIGVSRIYLGVHYPSDVLAGWCVGTVWAVIAGSLIVNRPFALGRRLTPSRISD